MENNDPSGAGYDSFVIGAVTVTLASAVFVVMFGKSCTQRFRRTSSTAVVKCPAKSVVRIDRVDPPNRQESEQEVEVWLHGSGFQPGMSVSFGVNPGRVLRGLTETTARVMTPGGRQGPVTVVARNTDGGQDSRDGLFDYVGPPTLTGVVPPRGPLGGCEVTLSGTNFHAGVEVLRSGTVLDGVQRRDAQTLVLTLPAVPRAVSHRLTVRNPARQSAAGEVTFDYLAPPRVDSIRLEQGSSAPGAAIGATSGTETAVIRGAHFDAQATVAFGQVALRGADCVVRSPDEIQVRTPQHVAANLQVRVTNPDGQHGEVAFSYVDPPQIQTVQVSDGTEASARGTASADTAGNETVQIDGAHFHANAQVFVGGQQVQVVDNAQVPQRLSIKTSGLAAGPQALQVRNPNQQASNTVNLDYATPPVLASVSVTAGTVASVLNTAIADVGGGETVLLTGDHFDAGATVLIGGVNVRVTDNSRVPRQLSVESPRLPVGNTAVIVRNPNQQRSVQNVALAYSMPPAITSISKSVGTKDGGTTLVILGSGFVGTPAVTFGATAAQMVRWVDATRLEVTTPAHVVQTVDITVTNPNQQRAVLASQYTFMEPPGVAALIPDVGPLEGDLDFVIHGRALEGCSVRFGGVEATQVVASEMEIRGRIPLRNNPANADTAVNVLVTGNGCETTLVNGFTYRQRPPSAPSSIPPGKPATPFPVTSFMSRSTCRWWPATCSPSMRKVSWRVRTWGSTRTSTRSTTATSPTWADCSGYACATTREFTRCWTSPLSAVRSRTRTTTSAICCRGFQGGVGSITRATKSPTPRPSRTASPRGLPSTPPWRRPLNCRLSTPREAPRQVGRHSRSTVMTWGRWRPCCWGGRWWPRAPSPPDG
ncbi:hypothetical protein A176_001515 [Myxococcus hansupus]|uniref:IPT/TIG domain-containing protein n=1 Tax=Pseudomyxococcus hansupus TaxID=1297742 RepID=A0A0H4WSS0_9BACT|nr:hypothetical protein A176_001515 [Myxococcus hansupus]